MKLKSATPETDRIQASLQEAIETLLSRKDASGGDFYSAKTIREFRVAVRGYCGHLRQSERAKPEKKKLILISARRSFRGRLSCVLRSVAKLKRPWEAGRIVRAAKRLDPLKELREPVNVRFLPHHLGKTRPIALPGTIRRATSLLVRDTLQVMGIEGQFDFARAGAGGEKALVQRVCKDTVAGKTFWSMPDVTAFYLSLRPGHFKKLPINDSLIRNVAFLSESTKFRIAWNLRDFSSVRSYLAGLGVVVPEPTPSNRYPIQKAIIKVVRQGLYQGSVLSPLMARWFLSTVAKHALPPAVSFHTWVDNIALGGTSYSEVSAALCSLSHELELHSAGPVFLHDTEIEELRKLFLLGYAFRPGHGFGSNPIHVKPGPKRIERFRSRLDRKLTKAQANVRPFEQVADAYARRWFGSQGGWTKVPALSKWACRNITQTYVADFLLGIPMGTWKINKPIIG